MGTIKGAKLCLSAFREQLETHRTPQMTRCFTNRLPFEIRCKACVCGTPLSFRITEPLSNCCSHTPSPLESAKKEKHEEHVDVCVVAVNLGVCAVTVLVVVVVIVVMVSAVFVLCVFCGCHVSIVMGPLLCVQCDCLAIDRTNSVLFHLLTSLEVKRHTMFIFSRFKK